MNCILSHMPGMDLDDGDEYWMIKNILQHNE